MTPYELNDESTWREVFEKVVLPEANDISFVGCPTRASKDKALLRMSTTQVSKKDIKAWKCASVHITREGSQSAMRYDETRLEGLRLDSLVDDISTIGLPDPKVHPRTKDEESS
ncbi:hypothetical protein L198_03655 [Cryptococcus wingfieldii CBS 7118]|uniref:Uncharacterized protein n=1 Tax=Cryptococcus wingfieldii CBS 7118 TaxID=1295528 RepID=A0A1E3JES8_9TREE|nr:hypothetical protein L198_03655 [Cryptococcus wingfieldii CBS 7118]ODN98411.1 hypothetical protein L198_03655 [Cryptococcus wingfieldii CBS 7118]